MFAIFRFLAILGLGEGGAPGASSSFDNAAAPQRAGPGGPGSTEGGKVQDAPAFSCLGHPAAADFLSLGLQAIVKT